jgi:hypothetical protein
MNSLSKTTLRNNDFPVWLTGLHQRSLSAGTIRHFGISFYRNYWQYPVRPDGPAGERRKAFDSRAHPKYFWPSGRPDTLTFYDHTGDLAERIAAANGILVLATGDPDVWALWEGGIYNATCTLMGEGVIPAWLVPELRRLQVKFVRLWPDCDTTGQKFALKLRSALAGSGISLEIYALPYPPGSKGDIGRLLVDVGAENLYKTLTICPPLILPDPAPPAPRLRKKPPDPPPDVPSLYASWCELVEQIAVAEWDLSPANAKGFSKNIRCPFHGETNPSASYNYNTHGLFCFVCGDHNTHEVAEHLGLPTWTDYKAEQISRTHATTGPSPTASRRFPEGLPYTINKRLLNIHLKVKVANQAPAALAWFVWHEMRLPEDAWFTAGEFEEAARLAGRNLSRDTVETGLEQLEAWGVVEKIRDICDLSSSHDSGSPVAKVANLRRRTRPAGQYRFLLVGEALNNFERCFGYKLREAAFDGVPDEVQPEYAALSPDDLQRLNEFRAPLYEAHAARRQAAQARWERERDYLAEDMARIRVGRCWSVNLPPGELRNARAYRDALYTDGLVAAGGERENAYRAQFDIGVSRSTLNRMRARNEVITVPRYEELPLTPGEPVIDQLASKDSYAVERGLCELVAGDDVITVYGEREPGFYDRWVEDHADTGVVARVRRPAAEKFAELATPEELQAAADLSARQRERCARRKDRSVEPPPAVPLTVPPAYTDEHVLAQAVMLLPEGVTRCDPETGEVYSPARLWQLMAEALRSKSPPGRSPP